jgi:hypothetical protein
MRVCEYDRARMQPLEFPQLIEAAINHHIGAPIRDHERRMHAVPSRALLDFTACTEKRKLHQTG